MLANRMYSGSRPTSRTVGGLGILAASLLLGFVLSNRAGPAPTAPGSYTGPAAVVQDSQALAPGAGLAPAHGNSSGHRPANVGATIFVPQTIEALIGTTHKTGLVTFIKPIAVETYGDTRRQLSAEEAAELNANRPPETVKPAFEGGQWIGGYGSIYTLYEAHIEWPDGSSEAAVVEAPGGLHPDGTQLRTNGMSLPTPGSSYLMFLRGSDGRYGPAPVAFEVVDGRLAPHFGNESGVGKGWLGVPAEEAIAIAEAQRTAQAAETR